MLKQLLRDFAQSSTTIKIVAIAVVLVWGMVLVTVLAASLLLLERPGAALPPTPGAGEAAISLEPSSGGPGTLVTMHGEGWKPNDLVLIYLTAPGQAEAPNYAVAGATADAQGRFTAQLAIPEETDWQTRGMGTVTARVMASGQAAQAFFNVVGMPLSPTETPAASAQPPVGTETTVPLEPTATPTLVVQPTPGSSQPLAAARTDLNVRGGPGTGYPVLGILRYGQTANITGVSSDGGWWQIEFSGVADGRGWVASTYVSAQNTGNVPVVQAPSLPTATRVPRPTATPAPQPTATPTATPVVIANWRGEYYNNTGLSGYPALVRNDYAVDFDWGSSSPGSEVSADNFSARWTRSVGFSSGTYRFHLRADDGARLWVDGALVVDEWHDSSPTTYLTDVSLSAGTHSLRVEYYDHSGGAVAQLAWQRISDSDDHHDDESYPDWKAEYFDNRHLDDDPVLVRNEKEIDHDWGTGSPSGVPSNNFSARWTRRVDFDGGTYRVRVWVDDGVRLWVDDTLVIDSWEDGSLRLLEAERKISDGKHRIKVEYYDRSGDAQIEVTWERVPSNHAPQAVLGGPYTVKEGSLVTFDGSYSKDSDGRIVKYQWDFNYDGHTFTADSAGAIASTAYPNGPATFTAALRVTDDDGATNLATTQVKVVNVAPAVEAGGPYAGQVGSPISLVGMGTDPGSADQPSLTYRWDFGDGAQGNGPLVSHSYAQAGSYTLKLTVTDKDGGQGSDTATVQVGAVNQPPTAAISGPASGKVGETLNFSGSGSSDGDGNIVNYAWDFGDSATASGVGASHAYAAAGSYQVTLTVTDNGGLTASAHHTVQVSAVNQPPTAVIGGPASGQVGQTLNFNSSGSSDADGHIVGYAWAFGDGATGRGARVSHAYAVAGSYQVTLTVTDNDGLTASASHTVQVSAPNQPPLAVIGGPATAQVGQEVIFDGSGSSDPEGAPLTHAWDFGDGVTGSGQTITHTYQHAATYTATLTVTDDGSLTDSATHTISITTLAE